MKNVEKKSFRQSRANTPNQTRYACILYYQVTSYCFFLEKKHEKNNQLNFKIMEHLQKTKQENQKTYKVIQSDQQSPMFPFNILEETTTDNENEQKDYYILLGNEKVSQPFDTQEQAEEYILQKPYELILALVFNTYKLMQQKEKEDKEIVELRKKQDNEKAQ